MLPDCCNKSVLPLDLYRYRSVQLVLFVNLQFVKGSSLIESPLYGPTSFTNSWKEAPLYAETCKCVPMPEFEAHVVRPTLPTSLLVVMVEFFVTEVEGRLSLQLRQTL